VKGKGVGQCCCSAAGKAASTACVWSETVGICMKPCVQVTPACVMYVLLVLLCLTSSMMGML
jgi:hypothetical protein